MLFAIRGWLPPSRAGSAPLSTSRSTTGTTTASAAEPLAQRTQQHPHAGRHHRSHHQHRLLEGTQHAVVDRQVRHQHDQRRARRRHRGRGRRPRARADRGLGPVAPRRRRPPGACAGAQPDQAGDQEHLHQPGGSDLRGRVELGSARGRVPRSLPSAVGGAVARRRRSRDAARRGSACGSAGRGAGCSRLRYSIVWATYWFEPLARGGLVPGEQPVGGVRGARGLAPWPVSASTVCRATSLAWAPVCVTGPAQARLAATRKTTTNGLSRTSAQSRCRRTRGSGPTAGPAPQHAHREQREDQAHQHHVRRGVVREHHARRRRAPTRRAQPGARPVGSVAASSSRARKKNAISWRTR